MIKSTLLVFLLLISLVSTAQISNTIFSNNLSQKNRTPANTSNQRAAAANKQRLDSIVSLSYKSVFTYDAGNNVILVAGYERANVADSWTSIFKTEYVYDTGGNAILSIKYYWDDVTNVFFPDTKYENAYDVNENLTSEITYSWYNSNWNPLQKTEYIFGSNGQISSTHQYYWPGSLWVENSYTAFLYNHKNLLAEETHYSPSPSNLIQSQKTYAYDAYDNLISSVNSVDGILEYKYEYTYDSKNNATLLLESQWNDGIDDWEVTYKTEYEFDLQNNQTAIIHSDWNTQTNMWVYTSKNQYSYDNSYAITDLIMPFEGDETFKHKVTNYVLYNFVHGDWELEQDYTVYYKTITTTGVTNIAANALKVYPNPASDRVVFTNKTSDASTLELFNQQGMRVYNNSIMMNQPVSVEGMAKGIYFYRITNMNTESYNGTLIIE